MNDVSQLPVRIRDMTPAEADAVAELLLACNQEHLAAFPPEVARSYCAELADVRARLPVADVLVAVADDRDELLGTVTLVRNAADDGHPWPPGGSVLRLLAVQPGTRGQGVGTNLAEACVQRAERLQARFVGLHTAPFMGSARALYERMGFRRAPEHDFDPDAHYGSSTQRDAGEPWGLAYVLELPRAGSGSRP
jgi:predicted N-acetyltransferase YhbS